MSQFAAMLLKLPAVASVLSFWKERPRLLAPWPPQPPDATGGIIAALEDIKPLGVSGLFKSLEAAHMVLHVVCNAIPELRNGNPRTTLFFRELDLLLQRFLNQNISFSGKIIIAVEGLRGSGKSAAVSWLCNNYDVSTTSLPAPFEQMAVLIDKLPHCARHAFRLAVCYALAAQIADSTHAIVFVDSYYHKCCADSVFAHSGDDLAVISPSVFLWPRDLPQPSVVVYLAAPRQIRCDRQGLTNGSDPVEELRDEKLQVTKQC